MSIHVHYGKHIKAQFTKWCWGLCSVLGIHLDAELTQPLSVRKEGEEDDVKTRVTGIIENNKWGKCYGTVLCEARKWSSDAGKEQ